MASSNWIALQKNISLSHPRKRRKLSHHQHEKPEVEVDDTSFPRNHEDIARNPHKSRDSNPELDENLVNGVKNGESLPQLRAMVEGKIEYSDAHKLPGKYICLDCEMVGVGLDGEESSLARVSVVNFYGAILLDEFVRQKERVVDYRTQWSGVRPADMVKAKPFEEVQKLVADILKDKILVGHALSNDLKALLLTHPRPYTRDTQHLAHKHNLVKTKRVALRNLVKQELGSVIQGGEHSSVTDARATMAVYRIHKKEWEKGQPKPPEPAKTKGKQPSVTSDSISPEKRKRDEEDHASDSGSEIEPEAPDKKPAGSTARVSPSTKSYPSGGRKGVSSGLSVIVKRRDQKGTRGQARAGEGRTGGKAEKDTSRRAQFKTSAGQGEWWKQLPVG